MNADFYESLPKKRMAAGALFVNEAGHILLIDPTYKATLETPGGVVELNESPRACCIREVQEEIGLCIPAERLLIVDYNTYPEAPHKTESLIFLFDGGVLSPALIEQIHFHDGEIRGFAFYPPDALPDNLNPALRRRLLAAYRQRGCAGAVYLENQEHFDRAEQS